MSEIPQIIDSVPGFPNTAVEQGLTHGEAVTVEDFKGDPRHVIGHSSNPTAEASAAYAEHLDAPAPSAEQAEAWGPTTFHEAGRVAVQAVESQQQ